MLKDGDGWALSRIESEERRSADVGELNRAVRESLGLEVSVLRCLSDEPGEGARPRRQLCKPDRYFRLAFSRVRWSIARTSFATASPCTRLSSHEGSAPPGSLNTS